MIETLKTILISLAVVAGIFLAAALFLLFTEIGQTIMAYVAGFIAWIIFSLAVL